MSKNKSNRAAVFPVRTTDFDQTIKDLRNKRNDAWSGTVMTRIHGAKADLHASDAIYHQICSVNFRTMKDIPLQYREDSLLVKPRLGRPIEDVRHAAYLKTASYLEENDEEQFSIEDLVHKLTEFLQETDAEAYSKRHMKDKLLEFFGEKLYIAEVNRTIDIVTL